MVVIEVWDWSCESAARSVLDTSFCQWVSSNSTHIQFTRSSLRPKPCATQPHWHRARVAARCLRFSLLDVMMILRPTARRALSLHTAARAPCAENASAARILLTTSFAERARSAIQSASGELQARWSRALRRRTRRVLRAHSHSRWKRARARVCMCCSVVTCVPTARPLLGLHIHDTQRDTDPRPPVAAARARARAGTHWKVKSHALC